MNQRQLDRTNHYNDVQEFVSAFEQRTYNYISIWMHDEVVQLRLSLIEEEIEELRVAIVDDDEIEIMDALTDCLYVIYGMLIVFGVESSVNYSLLYRLSKCDNQKPTLASHASLVALYNELKRNAAAFNYNKVADTLWSLVERVYTITKEAGYDMDKCMKIVHASNMSKLCSSEKEAIETVEWYQQELKEGRQKYDSPAWRPSRFNKYWIVYNESTGKILKNINYKKVLFEKCKLDYSKSVNWN